MEQFVIGYVCMKSYALDPNRYSIVWNIEIFFPAPYNLKVLLTEDGLTLRAIVNCNDSLKEFLKPTKISYIGEMSTIIKYNNIVMPFEFIQSCQNFLQKKKELEEKEIEVKNLLQSNFSIHQLAPVDERDEYMPNCLLGVDDNNEL